ncbi:MAG: dihydroorotate dehydrogenase-like protein [Deltaproteobacteria bacterium]|nr:dihydroorotate dehydrogenase-like protein [Deltaproteobacteria bacterium]
MSDLRTTYMGISLKNPLIVGSSPLSTRVDKIQALEAAGAAAVVLKSLFEEQVRIDAEAFEEDLARHNETSAEATSMFPRLEHAGTRTHAYWVKEARKAVKIPLIASINCLTDQQWAEYARALEGTGVDGLELNLYSPSRDTNTTAAQIEDREVKLLDEVRKAVKIPIAVKLHPFYTNLPNFVKRLEDAGANGFVMFNRLFQPDIDVDLEVKRARYHETNSDDALLPLRWTALISGQIKAGIAASTGIGSGRDMAKMILAGARATQVVGVLLREKPAHVGRMLEELTAWMNLHNYKNLEAFRGKLARVNPGDPWTFSASQYVEGLLGLG